MRQILEGEKQANLILRYLYLQCERALFATFSDRETAVSASIWKAKCSKTFLKAENKNQNRKYCHEAFWSFKAHAVCQHISLQQARAKQQQQHVYTFPFFPQGTSFFSKSPGFSFVPVFCNFDWRRNGRINNLSRCYLFVSSALITKPIPESFRGVFANILDASVHSKLFGLFISGDG